MFNGSVKLGGSPWNKFRLATVASVAPQVLNSIDSVFSPLHSDWFRVNASLFNWINPLGVTTNVPVTSVELHVVPAVSTVKSNLVLITFKKLEVSVAVAVVAEIIGVPEIINWPLPWRLVFTIFDDAVASDILTKTCLNTPEATPVKIISPFPVPFVTSTSLNLASKSLTIAFLTSIVVELVTAS